MRQRVMIAMALINEPEAADRRRADDGARRDRAGADPRADRAAAARSSAPRSSLITHDLGVVAEMADDIAVMYAGRIVEHGAEGRRSSRRPQHPYTWGLLRSIPRLDTPRDEELVPIAGRPPSLINLPTGCSFHPRCPYVREAHKRVDPTLEPVDGDAGPPGRLPARRRQSAPSSGQTCARASCPSEARAARAEGSRMTPTERARRDESTRSPRGGQGEPLIEVRDLVKHFPITGGLSDRRAGRRGARRRRRLASTSSAARRSGSSASRLRQVDDRAPAACGCSSRRRARSRFEGARDRRPQGQASSSALRREMQMIFQDPYSSLNPRKTVGTIIGEPFAIHGLERRARASASSAVQELMDTSGSTPSTTTATRTSSPAASASASASPARSRCKPKLIVADEPVSALDVSIQAQILNLLRELQRDLGLTLIFIAHDLSVVRHMCDRVAVMYLGKIVELASSDELYAPSAACRTRARCCRRCRSPTRRWPRPRSARSSRGDVPSPTNPPPACRFHTRCWKAQEICRKDEPPLEPKDGGNIAACHFPLTDAEVGGARPGLRGV